jgi:hypothetical protein
MNGPLTTFDELVRTLVNSTEDQRHEFKAADIVKDPDRILREAVGMLNSEGGEIFLGVGEVEGRASSFEGVEDFERQKTRLTDILLDRIKPRPPNAITIRAVQTPDPKRAILIIDVPRSQEAVHAYTKGEWYGIARRHGDRLRPLSWDEVQRHASGVGARSIEVREAKLEVSQRIDGIEDQYTKDAFWFFLAYPIRPVQLDDRAIREAMEDAVKSGNRRMGFTYEVHDEPRTVQGGFEQGRPLREGAVPYRHLTLRRDGQLEFLTGLEDFDRSSVQGEGRSGPSLYPYPVVEYPVSLIRLLSVLYPAQAGSSEVFLQETFNAIQGATLVPGRPEYPSFPGEYRRGTLRSPALDPLLVTVDQIRGEPDRIAYRLLREVYEGFGHQEDAIPFFDRISGRFNFP